MSITSVPIELSWAEAESKFYETHDCLSDDVDKEEERIMRWAKRKGIVIVD